MDEFVSAQNKKFKIITKNGVSYKVKAPDGGWGYMVMVGVILILGLVQSIRMGILVINDELFKRIGLTDANIGFLNSLGPVFIAISSYVAAIALRKYSIRQVGLVGALVYAFGMITTALASTPLGFILSYGVLVNFGEGIVCGMSLASFNTYFDKNKLLCNSFIQATIGILLIVGPPLVNYLREAFGLRQCLMLLVAITLHTFPGFLLLQPVERHLKREMLNALEKVTLCEYEVLKTCADTTNAPLKIQIRSKKYRIQNILYWIADFFDVTLFKDIIFTNICFGVAIMMFSDMMFLVFFPLYLYSLSWNSTDVSLIISISNMGDFASRLVLIVITKMFTVKCRSIVFCGEFVDLAVRFTMPYITDKTLISCASFVWGLSRGIVMSSFPVILAEYLPVEKYPAGQSLMLLTSGTLALCLGPMLGAIQSFTGSYLITLHTQSTLSLIFCVLPWGLEMLYFKFVKHSREFR